MTREEAINEIKSWDFLEGKKIDVIHTLIPELKESEDERIKKTIRQLLETARDAHSNTSLAKPFIDALAWLEKQKEQKPVDYEAELKKCKDNPLYFYDKYVSIKQKSEWSDEDEKRLKQLIYDTEHIRAEYEKKKEKLGEDFNNSLIKDCDEQISWLKSLPGRFSLQPKAELTLLDENIIKAAVAFVEQNDHFNCWGGIDKHTVIKALRSLKPHWKPSDVQMKYLLMLVDYFESEGGTSNAKTLRELYENLKKL